MNLNHSRRSTLTARLPLLLVACRMPCLHFDLTAQDDIDDDDECDVAPCSCMMGDMGCTPYSCWYCMPAAPAAPFVNESEVGEDCEAFACSSDTCASGCHDTCSSHSTVEAFSCVWDVLQELDELLCEMSFGCVDRFGMFEPGVISVPIPILHATVLCLDELIPVQIPAVDCVPLESRNFDYASSVVGERLALFQSCMLSFCDEVWGAFHDAMALDDCMPMVLDGAFTDAILCVALDLLDEFAAFGKPSMSLEFFERVGD